MATAPEGIMALEQPAEAGGPPTPAMPKLTRNDFYDVSRKALQTARPDIDLEVEENLQAFRKQLDAVPEKALRYFLNVFQQILDHPEDYKEARKALVEVAPGMANILPEEFDEELLSVFAFIFEDALRSRQGAGEASVEGIEAMMPQRFAKGGIAEAARLVASQGRGGDTMLAHINPREAQLLKAFGGSGTINPKTGQPEFIFGWIKDNIVDPIVDFGGDVVDAVIDVGRDVVNFVKENPIARAVATIALAYVIGPQSFALFSTQAGAAAAAAGTVSALTGGNLKDIALSSLTAYIGAPGGPVSNFVGKYAPAFVTSNPYVMAAVSGGISGTASGLIQGQSLSDSLRNGLTEGAISAGMTLVSGGNTADAAKNAADATTAKTVADAVPANPSAVTPLELDQLKIKANKVAALNFDQVQASQVAPPPDLQTIIGGNTQKLLDEAAGIKSVPVDTGLEMRALSPEELIAPSAAGGPGTSGYLVDAQGRAIANAPVPVTNVAGLQTTPLDYNQNVGLPNISGKLPPPSITTAGAEVPAGGIGSLQKVPSVSDSLKKIARGDVLEGVGDLFMPSGPSTKDIINSPEFDQLTKPKAQGGAGLTSDAALKVLQESSEYNPSFMRTYGPTAAAGIAGLALAGGFKPQDQPKTQEQQEFEDRMRTSTTEVMERDPSRYYIQNIPGVRYDKQGKVIGTGEYQEPYTMANITGGTYSPYSVAPTYSSLPSAFTSPYGEQYLNQGGIATLAAGGYPRRTGQISGPGTETSDDIPAMLSDGEFVMTARAVRGMGNGSRREGARKMYALMHKLEQNAARG